MLDKLLHDHATMRAKAQALLALLDQDNMPDPGVLADTRWQLSSFIMQHLAYEDRHLYSKLLSDERPHVVATGKKFQAELSELFGKYTEHAQFWTPDRIAADWQGFRTAARQSIEGMHRRIDHEERELFPLVADASIDTTGSSAPTNNWARHAFAIKDAMVKGAARVRAAG